MAFNDVLEKHLKKNENIQDFNYWAFGNEISHQTPVLSMIKNWNDLHGHQYTLRSSSSANIDIPIMLDLWRSHRKKK